MAPAQQGFDAKHAPVHGIVLRLVVEEQLAPGEGLPQIVLKTQPLTMTWFISASKKR
jgi:hypothetical protein